MVEPTTGKRGVLQSILLGYLILLLHIFLIILIAVSVVFLEGVHRYMGWILGVGLLAIGVSGLWFWRRARRNALRVGEFLAQSVPADRPVEISFLGGMAQVRLGASSEMPPTGHLIEHLPAAAPQLDPPETQRLRQLEKLAEMLDRRLLTETEFQHLKADLLAGSHPTGPT